MNRGPIHAPTLLALAASAAIAAAIIIAWAQVVMEALGDL